MAEQAGPVKSNGTTENMYRIFRLEYPFGTVKQFQDWFAEIKKHQESVKPCPWCKGQPALRVGPGPYVAKDGFVQSISVVYSVSCEGEFCPVNPCLNEWFDNAAEAVAEWGGQS